MICMVQEYQRFSNNDIIHNESIPGICDNVHV